jgi:tRNA(adenine34) deaminase
MLEYTVQPSLIGVSAPIDLDQSAVDVFWMEKALQLADEAEQNGEVPVGAVIVQDGVCIAAACNAPIGLNDPTAHAEILALRAAGQRLNNYRLPSATLYVSLEPCSMCAGAMIHARISRVVFGASDPRTGACGSVFDILRSPSLNHQCMVTSDVLASDSAQLLQSFFRRRRRMRKTALDSLPVICQD